MRIIKRKTLIEFWSKHADAEQALKAWFYEITKHEYPTPQSIKDRFGAADVLSNNRIVFNIKGNHYRLIVEFHYNTQQGFIRFVGTHKDYDKIDAEKI